MTKENRAFKKQAINLEGAFKDCTFDDCDITYKGGPLNATGCSFTGNRWLFSDAAQRTIMLMHQIYRDDPTCVEEMFHKFGKAESPR